jgi:hypothetical protein
MFGILKVIQGWVKIKGDTDGTKIGNVSDAIKVDISSVTDEVLPISHVDPSNTTSTPLGIGGVFTGTWHECDKYSSLTFTALTDQISAINGVSLQFSQTAGIGGLSRELLATVPPTTEGIYFSVPVEDAYYRIVYTNGATAQTVFKFTTQLKTANVALSAAPVSSNITDLTSVPIVRSVLAGKSLTTGQFENITTQDGRIRVEAINVAAPLDERFREFAKDGSSIDMNVDGSTTPVDFFVNADTTDDLNIDFLSFQAFDSGIKIDNFLGMNSPITNGVVIEIKSNDKLFTFQPIRNTTEFNSLFAFGPGRAFDLVFASGNDSMVSIFGPSSPFVLKKQGTFGTDDYIKVTIQDDIDTVARLRMLAGGRVS